MIGKLCLVRVSSCSLQVLHITAKKLRSYRRLDLDQGFSLETLRRSKNI